MRFGWWENTVVRNLDYREAWAAAMRRTVDVEEDIGCEPALSVVRMGDTTAATASIAQIPVRSNARGWELTAHPSLESRRVDGAWREIRDLAEELVIGRAQRLMVHVEGPWSFGANVEYRGHALLRDRPAFRDCAVTLGEAVAEAAQWWSEAMGSAGNPAEVIIAVHEPRVAEVASGLSGSTDFDTFDPVDRQILAGVWERFASQVRRPMVLNTHGPLDDGVVDAVGASEWEAVVVAPEQLQSSAAKDRIGQLIGTGQRIGWALGSAEAAAGVEGGESAAVNMLNQWRQWSFEEGMLPRMVDVVVPEGVRTKGEASEAAAAARIAVSSLVKG
ncbi:hypothetical protein [Corynebacterium auriscanis]|uniref:hypothetical protein n=1 Tax=Corynebacterium auriscanis TaxID=99807 RepID=UPI0024AD4E28|nr:hypothetical protein [Corynebacterium auriscanis]